MKFAVKTCFRFTGTFHVKAHSKAQAKKYVDKHCGLVIGGTIHSSLPAEYMDWDFPVHPEKIIGAARKVSDTPAAHKNPDWKTS
jgi:hypothetical protein